MPTEPIYLGGEGVRKRVGGTAHYFERRPVVGLKSLKVWTESPALDCMPGVPIHTAHTSFLTPSMSVYCMSFFLSCMKYDIEFLIQCIVYDPKSWSRADAIEQYFAAFERLEEAYLVSS